jgi:glycosyltransferase involved in cell wall biosynthesis
VAKAVQLVNPRLAQRIAGRHHVDLNPQLVHHNRWLLLRQRIAKRRATTPEAFYKRCAELERDWILATGFGNANVLGGFVRNLDPSLCRAARDAGLRVVVDQMIAPAIAEQREADEQRRRWPGWEPPVDYSAVAADEAETWNAADRITCASDYVRDGLIRQGVAAQRITVNPYPVAAPEFDFVDRSQRTQPISVGMIGQVCLRKGAPYFFEVARRLSDRARFFMVGPVTISADARKIYAGDVELIGPVPRGDVRDWLNRFDVFFFPSTCEGSPSAVAEAMLTGLPVVTTPNSGTLVRDEIEGFVSSYDDVDRLTDGVRRLIDDPSLRRQMGEKARLRALEHNLESFGRRLEQVMYDAVANPPR